MPDITDHTNRCYVVTGANAGIGAAICGGLAAKGAHVVMACRSLQRGLGAIEAIQAQQPQAKLSLVQLDLADLDSVRRATEEIAGRFGVLDGIVNNAGVYPTHLPDAFNVNHLGHFAFTCRLLNLRDTNTQAGRALRVVTMTSAAHRLGGTNWQNPRSRFSAYATSKLANLLFASELNHRARDCGVDVLSVAFHPGAVATDLAEQVAPGLFRVAQPLIKLLLNTPEQGAAPGIHALTDEQIEAGAIYTPVRRLGLIHSAQSPRRGAPPGEQNRQAAAELWALSEQLTKVQLTPQHQ